MRIAFLDGSIHRAKLTTEHAASSYGQPVLLIHDEDRWTPFGVAECVGLTIGAATERERKALADAGYRFGDPDVRVTLRIPTALHDAITRSARRNRRSLNAEIVAACERRATHRQHPEGCHCEMCFYVP